MKKSMIALALGLALAAGACAQDATASDEYQALEAEVADLEQQVSDTAAELAAAQASLEEVPDEAVGDTEIPAEVLTLLDDWWAANERGDGSVADLYTPSGYHLYGSEIIERDELAAHFGNSSYEKEWITEPYLIAAEPEGRYVVTRGLRTSAGSSSYASAFTFEILTSSDGEPQIAQTSWTYVH